MNPDHEKGYAICHKCFELRVKVYQAGYDVEMFKCGVCNEFVADKEEFFMTTGAEILSK